MNDPGDPAHVGPAAAPEDEALLRGAREGEDAAVELLYADNIDSARRLATILVGSEAGEELVAESFARVIAKLRAGGGPNTNFRAYLNTTIRNLHRDQLRRTREVPASDRPWLLDDSESPVDEFVEQFDANGATTALASLPGSWQRVLWHAEVEGRKPAEIAELLETTPAAVSSLVYRAREGLRRAFLDQHVGPAPIDDRCRWTRARLSQYVRDDLNGRAAANVSHHLDTCSACAGAHAEMAQLNTKLAAYLAPVVLIGGLHALDEAGSAGAAAVPSQLVTELTARAEGMPVKDAAAAANAGPGGPSGRTRRVSTTVAAAAVIAALLAISATTFALTRDEGEPGSAQDDAVTTDPSVDDPTSSALPTPTPARPEVSPPATSAPVAAPGLPAVVAPSAPVTSSAPTNPTTPGPVPPPGRTPTVPSPTGPPTVPIPGPVLVRPVAPTATPISRCGSYGSLQIPRTTGLRYALVDGNGREGPWRVRATALPGYAIAKGAKRQFDGDLGPFELCPVPLAIRKVTTTRAGDAADDPWQVAVTPTAPEQESRALSVSYWFDTKVVVLSRAGRGWTCRGPGGGEIGAGAKEFESRARLTCSLGERGVRPTAVTLVVRALNRSGSPVAPSGVVSLSADGDVIDVEDFDSEDR